MDSRVKAEVIKRREEVLDLEYSLVEQAHKAVGQRFCRLVDIGCGPFGLLGRKGCRLAELQSGSLGIDLDLEGLARNSHVTHRICASCYDLPLENNSVDIIVCRWVFEHLEHPEAAMSEFSRVLKKGGFLYIKTPNRWNYAMILSSITPTAFHNFFLSSTGMRENTPTFYRANTKSKLQELAKRSAFEVRNIELLSGSYLYYSFNKHLFYTMRALSRLSATFTDSMQQTILCLMQKAYDLQQSRSALTDFTVASPVK